MATQKYVNVGKVSVDVISEVALIHVQQEWRKCYIVSVDVISEVALILHPH